MITLEPWAAAGLAFALLSIGSMAGFFLAAALANSGRADDAAEVAAAYRRGYDAGRAHPDERRVS